MPTTQTPSKILAAAVEQFDRHGIANVTSRQVSNAAGISNGNMTYHFPTMESLANAIFAQMLAEITEVVTIEPDELTLTRYIEAIRETAAFQRRYRFFYTDTLEVLRRFPDVGHRYQRTLELRFAQGRLLTDALQARGTLRPDLTENAISGLLLTIWMTLTFWPSQEAILGPTGADRGARDMASHVLGLLVPYLTTAGKNEQRMVEQCLD